MAWECKDSHAHRYLREGGETVMRVEHILSRPTLNVREGVTVSMQGKPGG